MFATTNLRSIHELENNIQQIWDKIWVAYYHAASDVHWNKSLPYHHDLQSIYEKYLWVKWERISYYASMKSNAISFTELGGRWSRQF